MLPGTHGRMRRMDGTRSGLQRWATGSWVGLSCIIVIGHQRNIHWYWWQVIMVVIGVRGNSMKENIEKCSRLCETLNCRERDIIAVSWGFIEDRERHQPPPLKSHHGDSVKRKPKYFLQTRMPTNTQRLKIKSNHLDCCRPDSRRFLWPDHDHDDYHDHIEVFLPSINNANLLSSHVVSPASGLSRSESVRAPLWEPAWGWELNGLWEWETASWESPTSSFRLFSPLDDGVPCNNCKWW